MTVIPRYSRIIFGTRDAMLRPMMHGAMSFGAGDFAGSVQASGAKDVTQIQRDQLDRLEKLIAIQEEQTRIIDRGAGLGP